MQSTQHSNTRCPVYLHPTAITSPTAVEAIQQHTGLLVIINIGRPATALPASPVAIDDIGPWGGYAA
ncbi:hypothetical protein KRR23_18115 [Pseudomonas sp. CVAP|uniref:hypothetical protein n=1 Tax=Pseudomonas sp. CVAP\|nr:hypothetical protein [Pseudomonas sp. CVAP\